MEEAAGHVFFIEPPQHLGKVQLGGIDKRLHLAGSERVSYLRAIGIDDGIARILPALVLFSLFGTSLILVESAIVARVAIRPSQAFEGSIEVRLQQLLVAGPVPDR